MIRFGGFPFFRWVQGYATSLQQARAGPVESLLLNVLVGAGWLTNAGVARAVNRRVFEVLRSRNVVGESALIGRLYFTSAAKTRGAAAKQRREVKTANQA